MRQLLRDEGVGGGAQRRRKPRPGLHRRPTAPYPAMLRRSNTNRSPPMPLSQPQDRDLLHSRDIELRGYRRADGLYDIEAKLTDTKSYGSANHDRGYIGA